ncbi:CRISPR-associated endonuclease Cas3'', partial [bacterium]|nr:CRISPR-associated endonuclease Cas3'' [bacterium]
MTKYIARRDEAGKDQLLEDHLTGVARLAAKFSAGKGWQQWARAAGLLHDAGKYSPVFQRFIDEVTSSGDKKSKRRGPDHSTAGARVAVEELYTKESIGWLLGYAIAGHHGGLPNGDDGKLEGPSLKSRVNVKPLKDYSEFPRQMLDEITLGTADVAGQFTDKSQPYFSYSLYFLVKFLYSCLVDGDFLDTEHFMNPEQSGRRNLWPCLRKLHESFFASIVEKFNGDNPSVLNQERTEIRNQCLRAAEEPVGLFSLTVPTGGGKTLSSLAFALEHTQRHGLKRIIYVIPYTSIIEQNAEVFREYLGGEAVLEHHSNFDPSDFFKKGEEKANDDDVEQWKKATENWDAPLVVTTNVQFFESLFHHRSSLNRKLHNMMDAVIILDEAQMIPTEYLLPSITALRVLSEQYNSSVVLCTATQPALEKSEDFLQGLEGVREIMEDHVELFKKEVFQRVKVKVEETPLTVEELAERMRENRRVLTVVNTRK